MDNTRREAIHDAMKKAEDASDHLQPAVCITLSVEDLVQRGYDPSALTQIEFEHLARKIGEDCMDTWWLSLEGRADDNEKMVAFASNDEMDCLDEPEDEDDEDDEESDDDEFKHTREFVERNATPEQ